MLGYARYVTMRYIHVWRYIKYYVKHCCQLYNSVLKKYSWSKYFLLFQTMSFSSRILAPKILNIAARLWWDSNLPIFTKMWIYFIVFLTTSKKKCPTGNFVNIYLYVPILFVHFQCLSFGWTTCIRLTNTTTRFGNHWRRRFVCTDCWTLSRLGYFSIIVSLLIKHTIFVRNF